MIPHVSDPDNGELRVARFFLDERDACAEFVNEFLLDHLCFQPYTGGGLSTILLRGL